MPINVTITNTGDPIQADRVRAALQSIYTHPGENWSVLIIGAQNNTKWEVRISGPNKYTATREVFGEDGGHKPEYLKALVEAEIRPIEREIKLALAELIRQGVHIGRVAKIEEGFGIEIEGALLRDQEILDLERQSRLTREGILEFIQAHRDPQITEGVRLVVRNYGEVLKKLADE